MVLVAVLDVFQYMCGLFGIGCLYQYLLETAFQCTIFFDGFAVFVQCGGAYALYLSACQCRFQHIGSIHRPCSRTCSNDGVYLIDEEDDIGVFLQLIEYRAQALLELSAILGAGHHGSHVEHHYTLVEEDARHLLLYDAQCQSLYDGRFAHARLADEHGIVLLAAAQNLCNAFNFLFASDDGVEFSFGSRLGHVYSKVVNDRRVARCLGLLLGRCRCRIGFVFGGELVVLVLIHEVATAVI